jgi:hypothetical protein
VGTPQAKAGEEYVINQVRLLEEWCRDGVLECEVWVQKGSGYHAYAIAREYKAWSEMELIVREQFQYHGP